MNMKINVVNLLSVINMSLGPWVGHLGTPFRPPRGTEAPDLKGNWADASNAQQWNINIIDTLQVRPVNILLKMFEKLLEK